MSAALDTDAETLSHAERHPLDLGCGVRADGEHHLFNPDTINKLQQAAEHYADVSAVVSMVRQLNELDDVAIEQLKQYPEAVQAAALIHYINCLGAALQAEQSKLEENFRCNRPELAKWNRGRIDELRKLLDEAVAMSKQTNPGLHVV